MNLQELQQQALFRMLSTVTDSCMQRTDQFRKANDLGDGVWKILIYDKRCQDILATIVKVGSLRQHGVSINVGLHFARSPIPEAPAIYFVEPIIENVNRIVDDLSEGLYNCVYVHFCRQCSLDVLEQFAIRAAETGSVNRIMKVNDRFLDFVSLSPTVFSLNIPRTFSIFFGPSVSDSQMELAFDRIANGLLSVCVTIASIPVICYPKSESSPARIVGNKLASLIKNSLSSPQGSLFPSTTVHVTQRPLLLIMDRDVALTTVLQHPWTYQALIDDVFGIKLNRVTIPVDSGQEDGRVSEKTLELECSDAFWTKYSGAGFPDVTQALGECLQEYNRKITEIGIETHSHVSPGADDISAGLTTVLGFIPEMSEKKKAIDLHTNICTAILKEIKTRSLDKFYELECEYGSLTNRQATQKLIALANTQTGNSTDRTRALLCLFLEKPDLTPESLKKITDTILLSDKDLAILSFLQHLQALKGLGSSVKSIETTSDYTTIDSSSSVIRSQYVSDLGNKFIDHSKGFFLKGVKHLLPKHNELPVVKNVNEILNHPINCKPNSSKLYPLDDVDFVDPKYPNSSRELLRERAFRNVIVFMVGGGNYVEASAFQDLAAKSNRHISYGATGFCSPTEFMAELADLKS